jgi:predicted GNAT superfamily acetyltransferase
MMVDPAGQIHHGIRATSEMANDDTGTQRWSIRLLDTPQEMGAVEELSRIVWGGSDLDVVPGHLLLTVSHNGGLVAGAHVGDRLVGFVFGFLGREMTLAGPRFKHCSHQLAVHPDFRSSGVGFALKRFQWQFVRGQGIERVTWTYDPLLSGNAHLNIAKLGAICDTYMRNVYGEARDSLNAGLPTDRFQVDWWVNSPRVVDRMEERPSPSSSLAGLVRAGAASLNPPALEGMPMRPGSCSPDIRRPREGIEGETLLLDIPSDFLALKASDPGAALAWRLGARSCLEELFSQGFIVDDFLRQTGPPARAAYVLRRKPSAP